MKRCALFFALLLPLVASSCDKDSEYDLQEEPINSDDGQSVKLLNFLGDSIIDYWENVSDFFPEYDCANYGWAAKGIDTFLGKMSI